MGVVLTDVVADALADFSDENGSPLVAEEYVSRAAERALALVGADVLVDYELFGYVSVAPDMSGLHRELWTMRTKMLVCRLLRAQAAQRVDFSSGDKRMSRSGEAKNWAELEKDLLAEYAALVKRENPLADESVLRFDVTPVRYKTGKNFSEDNYDDLLPLMER